MYSLSFLIRETVGSILFTRCCPICGERIETNTIKEKPIYVCNHCMRTLPRTEQAATRGNLTEDLFHDIPSFQRGAAFLSYDKATLHNLFHIFKYRHQPEIAYQLAYEAAGDFLQSDFFDEIDLIMPVPLHPKRFKLRGYNQCDYIAQALHDITHIPLDTTHLLRIKNNPQQALLKGKERTTNVNNIFQVNHPEELYRKHILLVDDILTTGSTLRACINALSPCKGAQFSVFVLGKAL